MKLFSFASRKKMNLSQRSHERREVHTFAKNASKSWFVKDGYFSDDLMERVKKVFGKKLSKKEMESKRRQILDKVGTKLAKDPHSQMKKMIAMYDELFFENTLEDGILAWKSSKSGRKFFIGTRVNVDAVEKGVAGITYIDLLEAGVKIDIATVLKTEFGLDTWVGKVPCEDEMACILLLMEHELVHLCCFFFKEKAMERGVHSYVFKRLLENLFGQTDIHHQVGAVRRKCTTKACPM